MFENYLKIAFRSIFRNKLTAFINIAGLALSMACAVMIYLYIADEVSFDTYSTKADRTYRITRDFISPDGSVNLKLANVAPPIGPLVKNDFGEVQLMARTLNSGFVVGLEENGELKKVVTENHMFIAEPDILAIFDINITAGDQRSALTRPFTVLLSRKTAERYFGTPDAVGKRLIGNNKYDLEVTGIYDDLPAQSHWHPDFLLSFSTLYDSTIYGIKGLESNWGNNSFGTYVVLEPGADASKMEAQMPSFLDKHFGPYAKANFGAPPTFVASKVTALHVEKVSDVHLRSHRDDEVEANGNINNVYMMGTIGLFIVLIACFNFVNLSTARATKRAKEVGLRKVVGAFKKQLVTQYLSESVLIALIALVLGVGLSLMALPWLNQFTGKGLSFHIMSGPVLPGLILFAVVVGILAGIYPALIISGFKPVAVLKGQPVSSGGRAGIRKVLVVAQFAISIILIVATAVTSQQLDYLNNRNLGYDKDQVVTLPYFDELAPDYESFYNELTKNSIIKNASRSSRVPTGRLLDSYGGAQVLKDGNMVASNVSLKTISTDEEFFDAYGIDLEAGRSFSKSIKTDDSLAFIVNETAARELGWTDTKGAIGQDFTYSGVKGKLIGIVKDFHFESLHQSIVPMIFVNSDQSFHTISIKIQGNNVTEGISFIEKKWKEFLPKRPFEYQFISQRYARLYVAEQKENQLFSIFSGLAIFIACLGLFGLATFNTLQRLKEIGIRKVLGASVPGILALLSKEIVLLVLAANVIAWPAAWFLLNTWLGSFAYHVDINLLVFVLAAFGAIALALLTVSFQTFRAAVKNPTETLRYE